MVWLNGGLTFWAYPHDGSLVHSGGSTKGHRMTSTIRPGCSPSIHGPHLKRSGRVVPPPPSIDFKTNFPDVIAPQDKAKLREPLEAVTGEPSTLSGKVASSGGAVAKASREKYVPRPPIVRLPVQEAIDAIEEKNATRQGKVVKPRPAERTKPRTKTGGASGASQFGGPNGDFLDSIYSGTVYSRRRTRRTGPPPTQSATFDTSQADYSEVF